MTSLWCFYYQQTCNFIKKRLEHKHFPVNNAQFLRTPILKNICKRLLSCSFHLSRDINVNKTKCAICWFVSYMKNVNLNETCRWISRMVGSCLLIFLFLKNLTFLTFNSNHRFSIKFFKKVG